MCKRHVLIQSDNSVDIRIDYDDNDADVDDSLIAL